MDSVLNSSLMFHHFHGGSHPKVQGSISADDLKNLLTGIGLKRFKSPEHFLEIANSFPSPHDYKGSLMAVTFDDGLKCQVDVALNVLDDLKIKAFWFVNTGPLLGEIKSSLEIYRYFRTVFFSSINEFYEEFKLICINLYGDQFLCALNNFMPDSYLPHATYYSPQDREFRYIRDRILTKENYHSCMNRMIEDANFDIGNIAKNLWIDIASLKMLADNGHIIGLHSHSHPTLIEEMDIFEQKDEYHSNLEHIQAVTNTSINSMSHPCNSYNSISLNILEQLGVRVGFRADEQMAHLKYTWLEMPRIDHAIAMNDLKLL